MKFVDTPIKSNQSLPTTEDPSDTSSPQELLDTGFREEHCTVYHDGSVAFFLVEDRGQLKWFTLRYD